MAAVEPLVDVVLVLGDDRPWSARPHGDGFTLEARVSGALDGFRHWQLEGGAGEILTSGDNEVFTVRARSARSGPVELPDAATVGPAGGLRARMPWPADCGSTFDVRDATAHYELRFGEGAAARWAQLGDAAWVATTADGALARLVVETARIETERIEVALRASSYEATYTPGLLRVQWRTAESPASTHESLRDNAWLTLSADGTPWELAVHDSEAGVPVPLEYVTACEELALWQEWPCEVTASRWPEEGRAVAEVRFGADEPDVWSRLENGVAVGASSAGKLLRLVVPGVVEHEHRPYMFGRRPPDPFAAIAEEGAPELTVYGLAGEEGVLAGTTGIPGALESVSLVFGDREAPPFVEVQSSRDPFLLLAGQLALELVSLEARANVPGDDLDALAAEFERLRPGEDELFGVGADLEPVVIVVDGEETQLDVMRRGDHWGGITRVSETAIVVVGSGGRPEGLELETVHDVAGAARRFRERHPLPAAPLRDEELSAAGETIDGLIAALQRNAGAPDLGGLFTSRVTAARGGGDRYARLLGLHAMLRPIRSFSASHEASQRRDDGSVLVTFSVEHGTGTDSGWTSLGPHDPDGTEPDPAAVRAGAPHTLAMRLVREDGAWLIDTDLLALLEGRLGTVDELVRPLSEQR